MPDTAAKVAAEFFQNQQQQQQCAQPDAQPDDKPQQAPAPGWAIAWMADYLRDLEGGYPEQRDQRSRRQQNDQQLQRTAPARGKLLL